MNNPRIFNPLKTLFLDPELATHKWYFFWAKLRKFDRKSNIFTLIRFHRVNSSVSSWVLSLGNLLETELSLSAEYAFFRYFFRVRVKVTVWSLVTVPSKCRYFKDNEIISVSCPKFNTKNFKYRSVFPEIFSFLAKLQVQFLCYRLFADFKHFWAYFLV